jgi:hypothetical protein
MVLSEFTGAAWLVGLNRGRQAGIFYFFFMQCLILHLFELPVLLE